MAHHLDISPSQAQMSVIESCKVTPQMDEKLKQFASRLGMTVYELLQYFCATVVSFENWKTDGAEVRDEVFKFLQTFQLDHPEVEQRLKVLRRLMSMKTVGHSTTQIQAAILVLKGGVLEVYDPQDSEGGVCGSVTIDREKALRLCLSGNDDVLPTMLTTVMADRHTTSAFAAIIDLLRDENRMLGTLDDDMLGYSQNEYGNAPVRTHNRHKDV